jgi:hypothetical protein
MKFGGFTEHAAEIIDQLSRDGEVHVMIDDDGCCGFSNVFVRTGEPPVGEWLQIHSDEKSRVYVHPGFQASLGNRAFFIDVVDRESDDSFSAETSLGKKLLLRSWSEGASSQASNV